MLARSSASRPRSPQNNIVQAAFVPSVTSRKDRTHIRPQPEDVMGVGLEKLKEARFSPLFYAGKNYKKLYVFSNDKGTLLLKKIFFNFDHDTLPLMSMRTLF